MQSQHPQLVNGNLPVFVFPSSLTFYSDDQTTHKQILTLYNPYEFALKFKVLSTSPRKYTVVDSEGVIRPRCCVDIVVRHTDICINNEGVKDKFRIQVTEHGQKKVIGKKDLVSVLLPKRDASSQADENFQSLPSSLSSPESQRGAPHTSAAARDARGGPGVIVILTALSCIVALMLPLQGDSDTRLPDYLHLSVHQKLIAAYILGLVTMVILQV